MISTKNDLLEYIFAVLNSQKPPILPIKLSPPPFISTTNDLLYAILAQLPSTYVFDDNAERDQYVLEMSATAFPVQEGRLCYTKDTNTLWSYDGAIWQNIGGDLSAFLNDAKNGVSKNGQTVELGGEIIKPTEILMKDFKLKFNEIGSLLSGYGWETQNVPLDNVNMKFDYFGFIQGLVFQMLNGNDGTSNLRASFSGALQNGGREPQVNILIKDKNINSTEFELKFDLNGIRFYTQDNVRKIGYNFNVEKRSPNALEQFLPSLKERYQNNFVALDTKIIETRVETDQFTNDCRKIFLEYIRNSNYAKSTFEQYGSELDQDYIFIWQVGEDNDPTKIKIGLGKNNNLFGILSDIDFYISQIALNSFTPKKYVDDTINNAFEFNPNKKSRYFDEYIGNGKPTESGEIGLYSWETTNGGCTTSRTNVASFNGSNILTKYNLGNNNSQGLLYIRPQLRRANSPIIAVRLGLPRLFIDNVFDYFVTLTTAPNTAPDGGTTADNFQIGFSFKRLQSPFLQFFVNQNSVVTYFTTSILLTNFVNDFMTLYFEYNNITNSFYLGCAYSYANAKANKTLLTLPSTFSNDLFEATNRDTFFSFTHINRGAVNNPDTIGYAIDYFYMETDNFTR